jgi:hypothetical protein
MITDEISGAIIAAHRTTFRCRHCSCRFDADIAAFLIEDARILGRSREPMMPILSYSPHFYFAARR